GRKRRRRRSARRTARSHARWPWRPSQTRLVGADLCVGPLCVGPGADTQVRSYAGSLRTSPEIHHRHAVDAADRTIRRARLPRRELAADVVDGISLERHGGEAALLRAVVDEPVLADVQIPRARAAAPVVRPAVGQVVLKVRDPRVQVLDDLPRSVDRGGHLVVYLPLDRAERLEPAVLVIDFSDLGVEAEI